MSEHTQNLILEVTALRCKLDKLQRSVTQKLESSHRKAIMEYTALVEELFFASLSIKNRFEEYRWVGG